MTDKAPAGGGSTREQRQKRLDNAVAELQKHENVFPLVRHLIEGLQGVREDASAEMRQQLSILNSDVTGLRRLAAEIEIQSRSLGANSERFAGAQEQLAQKAAALEEQAGGLLDEAGKASKAAADMNEALSSLQISTGGRVYTGVAALRAIGQLVGMVPETIQEEVEKNLTAKIEPIGGGEPKEYKGAKLIEKVVEIIRVTRSSAGAAVADARGAREDAEHAEEIMKTAQDLVEKANALVEESRVIAQDAQEIAGRAMLKAEDNHGIAQSAQETAGRALEAAVRAGTSTAQAVADGALEGLSAFKKEVDMSFLVIKKVLAKRGIELDISDEELAQVQGEAEEDSEETTLASFKREVEVSFGVIKKVLEKNGIDFDLSEAELAEVEKEAEEGE